ncbi:MAG: DNA-deoxyinosine glycosylase [Clostridia bacterium]|nr:DNA-deoxyinosine glycosylase [Clostridia bacterium]
MSADGLGSVVHEIPPVWDAESKVLILGSFPSVKSREGHFFYHHPQNRFWKVLAALAGCEVPETIEEKKKLLHDHHIAVWDVIASCKIQGSSDSSIRDVVPNDLSDILSHARIRTIYTNGGTAYKMYEKYTKPNTNREAVKLPSTSPANAAWSLERLIEAWKNANIMQ